MEIDEDAKRDAVMQYGLPPELHVPIAARDQTAIQRFVGSTTVVKHGGRANALLVEVDPPRNSNPKLRIWALPESAVLHKRLQVWVHVDYAGYRAAYAAALPNEPIGNHVLDHVMNRRFARLLGFEYVRLVPISRSANSSSGTIAEAYGVDYQNSLAPAARQRWRSRFIQYADFADIVKMLNIKTGGAVLDGVNDSFRLLEERTDA